MLVNLNLKNKYINYSNILIDFSEYGLYFLVGKNGTGKTSIINKIVFGKGDVSFKDNRYQEIYDKHRYQLIAYGPQEIIETDVSVAQYIKKENENINENIIRDLMNVFDLSEEVLTKNFLRLSGGEKVKVQLISVFAKDTPYIFLDEPTNYLDDSAVEKFKEVIRKYSKGKRIIISSHDERLLELDAKIIEIDGCNIKIKDRECDIDIESEYTISDVVKPNLFKIAYFNSKRVSNYVIIVLMLLITIGLSFYYQYTYYQNYSKDDIPPEGYVLTYLGDEEYSDLNKTYVERENLEIESSNLYDMVTTSDIFDIVNYNEVSNIYIRDFPKYYEISSILYQSFNDVEYSKLNFVDTFVFSMPKIVYENNVFLNMLGLTDFLYLNEGRIPDENKMEVSISYNLLFEYFGYEETGKSPIGDIINIDGNDYTIVGVQAIDVCLVSYSDNQTYGIYKYNKDTYEKFKTYIDTYFYENGYVDKYLDGILIEAKYGKEKQLQNHLIKRFPANNFYSSSFIKAWKEKHNYDFELKFGAIFFLITFLMGLILAVVQVKQIERSILRIRDIEYYYIKRGQILLRAILISIIDMIAIFIVGILASFTFSNMFGMYNETLRLVLISNALLTIPTVICMLLKMKRVINQR